MLQDYPIEQLVEPLLAWYEGHARVLPWREEPTPYRVWISEVMLQQTRVEAVKPYFERFLAALPDVASLADCEEDRLLKLWEGLGYYNRVRNLQAAARQIMEQFGGQLPSEPSQLLQLKGIGHYTAGAIASIAYGIPVPAVDGNVFRILMRVSEDGSDIRSASVRTMVEQCLEPVIPKGRAAQFTQAMMELGATVCVPNGEPHCMACPWSGCCMAKAHGTADSYPVKSKAKPRKIEQRTVLLIRDGSKVLLHQRPKKGLLAGMYEFPNLSGVRNKKEALAYVESLHLMPVRIEPLEEAAHIFSHIEWRMTGYMIRVAQPAQLPGNAEGYLFAEASESEERYAIPAAFAAYVKYMNIRIGQEKFDA